MSISTATRDELCCEIINQYLFDKVWNEPVSEYRINVHPSLITKYSKVGTFHVADANVYLPSTNEPYFVWYMKSTDINLGLKLDTAVWYDTATVCNEFRTLVHTYTSTGGMLPKCSVFLRFNKSRSNVYIAIKKEALYKIGKTIPLDSLYLTFYYDSDVENSVSVYSTKINNITERYVKQPIIDKLLRTARNNDCITEFKNGIDITDPFNSPLLEVGNYYDFIVDNNVEFAFDINLTDQNESPVFLSDMDNVWKQLIHIPKFKNPNNEVITHNTCDFYIRRQDNNTGRYLHRATNGRTVTQVTHNDMAIPLFIVDAYRDYLQTQNVYIRCVVRKHDKDNRLIRDASYIDLLYNEIHSDADIIKFLSNENTTNITWWKASELEKSAYVKMMFDTPNGVNINNVTTYVDALGYYSVVNLLCKRIVDTTISDGFTGLMRFNLPVIYSGNKVIPVVYNDGRMLGFENYTYSCNTDENYCEIKVNDNIYLPKGTKISVEFFVDDNSLIYSCVPGENGVYTFDIPYSDFSVYQKITSDTSIKGVSTSSKDTYRLIYPSTNVFVTNKTDTGSKLTFNSAVTDTEFIIQNNKCCYFKTYNLKDWTDDGKNIAIPLENDIFGTDRNGPILNATNISVFLNHNYLVNGIDYFINTVTDGQYTSFSELVVQTMDNFNEGEDDILTILINVAHVEEISNGFSINDKLSDETPANLLFNNISSVHVNGRLERDVEYHGVYTSIPSDKYPEGSIFEIQTSVPAIVLDFVKTYAKNTDLTRLEILNEYFHKEVNIAPDILELEGKHRIYSVFMNAFITAVNAGDVAVVIEPSVSKAKDIIKPFLYLRDMDLAFKNINKNFIDLYPQYINYGVDANVKKFIDRYIKEYMPENTIPTMEVVYE